MPLTLILVGQMILIRPALAEEKTPEAEVEAMAEKIRAIFPGITIDAKDRRVDVQSVICLSEGFLELVACGKDSKEHESLLMVEAKPSHIHAALLLIGTAAGNPAMAQPLDEEGNRWRHFPPRGQKVKAFLVLPNDKGEAIEHPVSDFIIPSEDPSGLREASGEKEKFPDHFLFTGSQFHGEGQERQYLADVSGHVLSIATFGDETLGLSGFHGQDNGSLSWQINPEKVPQLGTKVILRLRPQNPGEEAKE